MIAVLDLGKKLFIIYIASLNVSLKILIYMAQKAQIVFLLAKKVIVLAEYLNFIDVFSKKVAVELFESFVINKHLINLKLDK